MMRTDGRRQNDRRRNRGIRRETLALRFQRVLRFTSCLSAAGFLATAAGRAQQQPPPKPSFQASVEVTSLDVSVVDDKGKPISTLTPADFVVRIDGNPRRVVTAEWIPLAGEPGADTVAPPPDGYSTNESSTAGRLIVMGIDQPNIRFGGAMAIAKAANAFIDRLAPSDRVAVAGFGTGAPATTFTADRARIKQAIGRMVGQRTSGRSLDLSHNIALVEAQAIDHGDRSALESVQQRECQGAGMSGFALEACRQQVEMEARSQAQEANHEADDTIQTLRSLFAGLRQIDAPKTLILISEGFVMQDQSLVLELGAMAAEARTSIYALKLDTQMFDAADARMPINPFADRQARSEGLETLAGAARGTLFTVTGTGQPLFERIESELSGYYLLGVESDVRDKDSKSHSVRIDVPQRGAFVRSRRQILNTPTDQRAARAARSPRQAVVAALGSPLLSSALPLRVASFALQGPERNKVQLLIHADIGADYPGSKVVSVGYVITDRNGRLVDGKSADMRLLPVMAGVPSPLQFTAGASLAPGEYTLKLAAVEGERIGTVEHVIRAALPDAGGLVLSELMVGGPLDVGELLTPTIGYQVNFGSVHGYMEAYGDKIDALTMEYEVATAPDAPALLNVDVPQHPVSDGRVIFTRVMPVHKLPPGKYILRAILSSDGASIRTLTRGFEIAPPKVLLTSADGLGDTSIDGEVFLPVEDAAMAPTFQRDLAIEAATLAPFRERISATVRPAFDQGIALLTAGDYTKAELSFKRAIDAESDSTAPLTYLAVCFAASGHDREAAAAWQTALVDGTDFPQIYQWLGDTLMRTHDFGEARAIFEEAVGKWPNDVRFTKPLAMLYGTFGRGREAVRTLERYLEEQPDDREAYYFAVQWLYTVHIGGAMVHNRVEDLNLAREYADAYAQANGPQLPLVRQWVEYLQNEGKRP
jgi:VWFA-related protein